MLHNVKVFSRELGLIMLRLHYMSLKNKISIASISLVLISTLFASGFFYQYVSDQTVKTAYATSSDLATQMSNYFDEKLRSIIKRVYVMLRNDHFSLTSKNSYWAKFIINNEQHYYAAAMTQISADFAEVRMTDSFIDSVYIYTAKGDFTDCTMIKKHGLDFMHTDLYKKVKESGDQGIYWGQSGPDQIYRGDQTVIPLVISYRIEGYEGDVFVIVNLDSNIIKQYISDVQSKEGGNILIVDRNKGKSIIQANASTDFLLTDNSQFFNLLKDEKGKADLDHHQGRYIMSYDNSEVNDWSLVLIRSEKSLLKSLDRAREYTLFVMGISILLCIVIALLISNGITKPLIRLEKTIKKVTKRDFEVRFDYERDDEIGQMGKSFNFMLTEIKELIRRLNSTILELKEEKDKVREEQYLKRKAELSALQAQINPHFLYNTLNSIVWMADEAQTREISYMAAALGTFFRVSLSKGQEFITLRDEIQHVQSYLYIQKIRYVDKIQYEFNIDQKLMDKMTIKLLLQPLVENAICHGISNMDETGIIRVTVGTSENGDAIELHVVDNGAGIELTTLEKINRRLKSNFSVNKEGYGIYNVNERIRLCFGSGYGLSIASEAGHGTDVTIKIPDIKAEDVNKYV